MSLSGQYLEELSRRYKKQVEELQQSFAKTLLIIDEQNKRSVEREQALTDQIQSLRDDMEELSHRIFSWTNICFYIGGFALIQIGVIWLILKLWSNRGTTSPSKYEFHDVDVCTKNKKNKMKAVLVRRKSIDGALSRCHTSTSSLSKKRRPSEEALHISGTYKDLLIFNESTYSIENTDNEEYDAFGETYKKKTKQKNRKLPNIKRTMSLAEPIEKRIKPLVRQDSAPGEFEKLKQLYVVKNRLDDQPILDENYEIYLPGTDLVYNEFMPDGPSGISTINNDDDEDQFDGGDHHTLNGNSISSVNSNSNSSSSSLKKQRRRLSSPAFLKSPFSRSHTKKMAHESSTGWEWYRLKKESNSSQTKNVKIKAKSESPEGKKTTTTPSQAKANGQLAGNGNSNTKISGNGKDSGKTTSPAVTMASSTTIDKKPGSFRRILKKVF